MSEPNGAFAKVRIDRTALVGWLDAPPSSPSRWMDWRDMGGRWYLAGGLVDLHDASANDLGAIATDVDTMLATCATNRDAVTAILHPGTSKYDAGMSQTRHVAFNAAAREFIFGALLYGEGLAELMLFLTLARSCATHLLPADHGVAVVHDYVFGGENGGTTLAALALGPGDRSRFITDAERDSAVGAFAELAQAIMARGNDAPTDQLDLLR